MKLINGWYLPDADTTFEANANVGSSRFLYQANDHLEVALRHVTNFECAIDGGAHVGMWSKALAPHFARVLACEPAFDTFDCLGLNLAGTGVERLQVALGAQAGSVAMTEAPDQIGNTGARFVQPIGEIPMVTIDSFALPSLGFLKLDVEGSEVAALQGALETLARCRPIVLFENKRLWARHYNLPKHAVTELLSTAGYRPLDRVAMDHIWGPA